MAVFHLVLANEVALLPFAILPLVANDGLAAMLAATIGDIRRDHMMTQHDHMT